MQEGNVSSLRLFFRKKWVLGVLLCDVVLIIVAIAIAINNASKTVVLSFNVVPADSQILVNGASGYSNGEYRVSPGFYEIEISHPDLTSKKFTVDLENQDIVAVTTFLADENFDYYKLRSHFGDFSALAQIASTAGNQTTDNDTSAEEFIAKFQRNYNLYTDEMPIYYVDYIDDTRTIIKSIMLDSDYSCRFTLCVKAILEGTDDKNMVNSMLVDAGFDIEEVQIEY